MPTWILISTIEAGIKWLLSLLIPGAGFIKAIMAIKDIIVFFVETAIMLIPAITDGIMALASGSVAGVAKAFELVHISHDSTTNVYGYPSLG